MHYEKERKLRDCYLKRKESKLRDEYLYTMNMVNEGTLKKELYEIFKDEMDIVNNNLL